ncbi:MAG TPA: ACP phosphodiesterase [Bacteroidales bacterium]|nr:ACP phosphodiesterase [Bacteroidales bacterium]HPO65324.1 ACP phosphodiesterase [Bacteroidales bacterium]
MNFLAHLYLSGANDEIRLGNFIGDYVKGNEYTKYPPGVRNGIILHRQIDNFTDNHPIVRQHKALFYQKYHKYSGIVTDILYDHYLSTQWNRFSDEPLAEYIDAMYRWIEENVNNLPPAMQKIIPSLVKNQWLCAYVTLEGIESVLIGMSKGTSLPAEHEFALFIIRKHYEELRHAFLHYFEELILFVNTTLSGMERHAS